MNLHRQEFTKEQVLDMPVFETTLDAPKDKTPFFLLKGHIDQKEHLLEFIERIGKMQPEEKKTLAKAGILKVVYWIRHKDGNVSDCIGHILMSGIIESMWTPTDELMNQLKDKDTKPLIEAAGQDTKPLDLGIPDSDLTFKA